MYKFIHVLYALVMTSVSISEAREHLPAMVSKAHEEAVYFQRHGHAVAVLIDPDRYQELLEAYEELQDTLAFDEAMAEEGPNIPWDQVKADLGL